MCIWGIVAGRYKVRDVMHFDLLGFYRQCCNLLKEQLFATLYLVLALTKKEKCNRCINIKRKNRGTSYRTEVKVKKLSVLVIVRSNQFFVELCQFEKLIMFSD